MARNVTTISVEGNDELKGKLRLIAEINEQTLASLVREALDARYGKLLKLSRSQIIASMQQNLTTSQEPKKVS